MGGPVTPMQYELGLGHVGRPPAPIPDRPPRLVVVGVDARACRALTVKHFTALKVTPWITPGVDVPRARLLVAWATPRQQLPQQLRDALAALESEGALMTWSP